MIKTEFSDFYKFSTSFGIILVIFGIAIYLYAVNYGYQTAEKFLTDYTPEKLYQEGYSNVTVEAFDFLYSSKIKNANTLISLTPFVSLVLILFGIFLFGSGLFKWQKKQERIDRKELADLEIAEREVLKIKKQSEEEVKIKETFKGISIKDEN